MNTQRNRILVEPIGGTISTDVNEKNIMSFIVHYPGLWEKKVK